MLPFVPGILFKIKPRPFVNGNPPGFLHAGLYYKLYKSFLSLAWGKLVLFRSKSLASLLYKTYTITPLKGVKPLKYTY